MRTTEQQSNTTVNLPVSTRSEDKHPPTDTALLEAAEKALTALQSAKVWHSDKLHKAFLKPEIENATIALCAAIEAHKKVTM